MTVQEVRPWDKHRVEVSTPSLAWTHSRPLLPPMVGPGWTYVICWADSRDRPSFSVRIRRKKATGQKARPDNLSMTSPQWTSSRFKINILFLFCFFFLIFSWFFLPGGVMVASSFWYCYTTSNTICEMSPLLRSRILYLKDWYWQVNKQWTQFLKWPARKTFAFLSIFFSIEYEP